MSQRPRLAMDEAVLAQRFIAFDRASVRRYDGDQRLHVELTNISKAAVNEYLGSEIPGFEELGLDPGKLYRLYRDPDELAKAAATFNNLQVLSRHVPVDANDSHPELTVGSTGTDAVFEAPFLKNSMVIWQASAIRDVEDDSKKELSSAYRYRADMTPGTTPDGEAYDGVMRDIVGNHVALVKEGRAGPDVVVGDTMENILMAKTSKITRTGAAVRSVIALHIAPRLAQDAKVDLTPILAKLTAKNFAASKPTIITALNTATKGKLAKDASLEDVTGLLDVLEKAEIANGDDEIDAELMPEETMDAEGGDLREFLKAKLGADDYAKACEMMKPAGASDEDDEEERKRKEEEAAAKTAQDVEAAVAERTKDMVDKKAMDAAIEKAVSKAVGDAKADALKNARETREAENAVRPYVGNLAMACDSAAHVYQTALTMLGVEGIDKIDPSAYPALLKAQSLPGTQPKKTPVAMDAAAAKSFAERFPHAAKIKVSA